MKKYLIGIIALVFSIGLVIAGKPDFTTVDVEPSNGHATVTIPEHAVQVAPGVFYLGSGIQDGQLVEGYAFVHYKDGFKGKPTCNNNDICEPELGEKKQCADCSGGNGETDTSSCYGFTKGAKWKAVEPYVVNANNTRGLDASFIANNLAADLQKWETAAGIDIVGSGSITSDTLEADTELPRDDINEVYFADILEPGAIAVNYVWGIWGGPPRQREILEWDLVFDDISYDWDICDTLTDCIPAGVDCDLTPWLCKMDFESIATHEVGHTVGLDDLYVPKCSEVTMYGYGDYGETKARTLADGDINGINKLY